MYIYIYIYLYMKSMAFGKIVENKEAASFSK